MPNMITRNEGPTITLKFNASTEAFLRVKMNSSREAVVAGAGEDDIGITWNGHSAGELGTVMLRNRTGTIPMIASGVIAVGDRVYGDAGGKVTATRTGKVRGIAMTAAGANNDQIEVYETDDGAGVVWAASNVTDSADLASSSAETAYDKTLTIPAGIPQVGDVLEIDFGAHASATNSTDTFTFKLKIGTSIVLASAAVDLSNDDVCVGRCSVVFRAVGASGSMVSDGTAVNKATASATVLAPTAIDTTAAMVISVTGQHSSNNAGNVSKLRNLNARLIRKSA